VAFGRIIIVICLCTPEIHNTILSRIGCVTITTRLLEQFNRTGLILLNYVRRY
jgi:hypothetical protein